MKEQKAKDAEATKDAAANDIQLGAAALLKAKRDEGKQDDGLLGDLSRRIGGFFSGRAEEPTPAAS